MKITNASMLSQNVIASRLKAVAKQSPIAMFAFAFLFAACSENETSGGVTNINQTGVDVVASVDELPKCQKDNEGYLVFVKGENSARICVDGKWFATKDSSNVGDFSCTTKELKDKSGIKIICNGDSIGVVLNGEKGATGAAGKDGNECAVEEQTDSTVKINCGGQSMTLNLGAATVRDSLELDSEMIAVSLDEVSGASQKGPFLSGSKVLVRELRDGRSLAQTGNTFNGKILNDKGEFKINAQTLMSQYVTLEATGYYRNEVTGENSSSELTLMAITNVLKSKIANINLLTHLEYERVSYLVTKKKYSVVKAKALAQREVFNLFGIDATGFSSSEYLNIAGASDEDGALLAFSVLLQGNRSVSQLSELLTKIAADMETDGSWDDAKTRMSIAEWAADADSSDFLATIRSNVKGWKLSSASAVPNFEQFVRNFWYKEYGLDSCSATKKGDVKPATAGKRKNTQTRYICKNDDVGNLRWMIASDIEKDTLGWGHDYKDGEVKNGQINENETYVYQNGNWRVGTILDNVLSESGGVACITDGDTSKVKYKDEYYVCTANISDGVEREWVVASELYNDTYEARNECSTTGLYGNGVLLKGRVHPEKMYACDNGEFRPAEDAEVHWNKGCVSYNRDTSVMFGGQYSYYWCGPDGWTYDFVHLNEGALTDERDGKTYKTVAVKTQVWMAENLNFEEVNNYCNDECPTYGRLYTWGVAMDSVGMYSDNGKGCGYTTTCKATYPVRGICPKGWHLPTVEEWRVLISSVGDSTTAGRYLKSSSGWAADGNGTDEYGISILPGGHKGNNGVLRKADFWTATEIGTGMAHRVYLSCDTDTVKTDFYNKNAFFSVRCVKDNPAAP